MVTILVLDDEPPVLQMLKGLLELERYEVQTTNDGHAALELIAQQPPDLILCDLFMPLMGGLELYQRLQESEATAGLPMIFMSGTLQAQPASLPGPFLRKPFEIDQLLRLIRQLC